MSPPYVFRIDEIVEAPDAIEHVDTRGHWIPSTDPNDNVRRSGGVSGKWWYCDTQNIREQPQLPADCALYKTFSVYYSGGYGFWILNGDVTSQSTETSWRPLLFDWDSNDYSSFITNAGENNTLRVQRIDQQWPSLLLPDIYHTQTTTPYPSYGGIKGELAIFLALYAFSTSRDFLPNVLPTIFQGGYWRTHGLGCGRSNRRGVVVSVYTAPTSLTGRNPQTSSYELKQYENGIYGHYFN